jgi:RNA polymerase Rpb2, domain 4
MNTCKLSRQCPQIFMNGLWIGVHRDPTTLVQALRDMRRQVDINTEVWQAHHPSSGGVMLLYANAGALDVRCKDTESAFSLV